VPDAIVAASKRTPPRAPSNVSRRQGNCRRDVPQQPSRRSAVMDAGRQGDRVGRLRRRGGGSAGETALWHPAPRMACSCAAACAPHQQRPSTGAQRIRHRSCQTSLQSTGARSWSAFLRDPERTGLPSTCGAALPVPYTVKRWAVSFTCVVSSR